MKIKPLLCDSEVLKSMNCMYMDLALVMLQRPIVGNTREALNVQFSIDANDNIAYIRNPSLEYILAESIWYFSGSESAKWIGQFASLWLRITDDGETSNSAYGNILLKRHGFNQIEQVIEELRMHPDSRRALVNINIPHPNKNTTKDEPCTIGLQFYIRNGLLNATGIMRSNDIWYGLPYDIIFFTELQKYIARQLGLEAGKYTHFVTSMHLYLRDEDKLKKFLRLSDSTDFTKVVKYYKIDFKKLISKANYLIDLVNKNNILDICKREGIIE